MARIRTIKPSFFRHEGLQDLEIAHPGKYVMLVFAGLWGHCDKAGHFEWRPRQLKLDILPFIAFDMVDTLSLLEKAGLIRLYTAKDRQYGEIPTFSEHQRITGKEAVDAAIYPDPDKNTQRGNSGETVGKQPGNTGDQPVAQEEEGKRKGIGREREKEEKEKEEDISSSAIADDVPDIYSPEKLRIAWNENCPSLPKCISLSAKRKTQCKIRLKERTMLEWGAIFRRIERTPFLLGANNRGWKASFDWIISNTDNALKVLESKYDSTVAEPADWKEQYRRDHPDEFPQGAGDDIA